MVKFCGSPLGAGFGGIPLGGFLPDNRGWGVEPGGSSLGMGGLGVGSGGFPLNFWKYRAVGAKGQVSTMYSTHSNICMVTRYGHL